METTETKTWTVWFNGVVIDHVKAPTKKRAKRLAKLMWGKNTGVSR